LYRTNIPCGRGIVQWQVLHRRNVALLFSLNFPAMKLQLRLIVIVSLMT
jgi:hypothetical protein